MANQSLIEALKQIGVEAVNAGNPTSIIYGNVISEEPLEIQINEKMILDKSFLVLTKNVQDYEVEFDIDFEGEGTIVINGGNEEPLNKLMYTKGKAKIRNALKKGDKVVMIQVQGGQKFVVLDKLEKAGDE